MNPTRNFRELIVWQRAHEFVLKVYLLTAKFPREETYGLTSQLRRAAVSIAANIAEGYAKRGVADKRKFLNISQGSLAECNYYLLLAKELNFNYDENLDALSEEVSKLLSAYSHALERKLKT